MMENQTGPLANDPREDSGWFRGILMRRRCDFCGTRIAVHGENENGVIMKCPQCLHEYIFFERP